MDSNSSVYVTDFPSNQVLKLGANAPAPNPVGFTDLHNPTGVAVDSKGSLYILEWVPYGRVRKFTHTPA